MTLADLAAMAEAVEGFEIPTRRICWCNNDPECEVCGGCSEEPDNSPAALLMAVHLVAHDLHAGHAEVSIRQGYGKLAVALLAGDKAPESIARAALVALLRAHGVEVPDARL